jgi:hypothetical protein
VRLHELLRCIVAPLRALGVRVLIRGAPRRTVFGVELVDLSGEGESSIFFERVTQALELIRTQDPRRFRNVQRFLRRIVLVRGGGAAYHPGMSAYMLDWEWLHISAPYIALQIVHESVHARLMKRGIRYREGDRRRIEELCVGEEIGFARRLPDSEPLVRYVTDGLSSPWWSDRQLHERRIRQLRSYGWPRWVTAIYDLLFRPGE